MKDKCPSCGHKFGIRGAPFNLPPKGSRLRKPEYYCPECGSQLQRVESRPERLAAIVGYGTMLVASAGTIWNLFELSVKFDRNWLLVFYSLAVVGIGANIAYTVARQHYVEKG
ncbi:MAG: hypothetical protein DRH23_15225 [Deltaproteobacteria bacterium]|jgi:rRNA maturation protein Nop10|nr:hypothetical protein [Deltaproteobacteria bacterium]MBW2189967.1 hypothetical protein [Deltaproteobacteria bacterium]MBW2222687.1 hypothetical protein [Deltaproteobacteria bacterium]MBW2402213.1 hypothetical protein [Deltaproteobacteria bacterium]MBW2545987.1 hypothetical protein [Deltaproteobacteria bacterium]